MNKYAHPEGTEDGISQAETQLNGAILAGVNSITVDSTVGFPSSGNLYIYDTGLPMSTDNKVNRVAYLGKTIASFTGCTNVKAHANNMYVRGDVVASGGCPMCGTFEYE
jgi:hypothetical protein